MGSTGGRIERHRTPRRKVVAALVLGAAVLTACSSAGGGAASTGTTGGTPGSRSPGTAGPPPSAPVERFEGSIDAFYEVPSPLPAGAPGALIRTMPIEAPPGEVGLRIMYHSSDAEGDDRAVTGLVYRPDAPAPEGGWPIVAWAHGTSGLAAPCAPSRHPSPPPAFGVRGVRVATDYIGLGPVGEVHPYLSAAAEGHAVIDSVAAARNLPEVAAGDDWVVAGVSQGGHAALVTGEQAAARLPGAPLLGTVSIAPGSQLAETYGDELQARVITAMVLVGLAAEDPTVRPADHLNPRALAMADAIRTKCVQDIIGSGLPLAGAADFFTVDPRTTETGKAWVAQNDPGQVRSAAPLLLVQGGKDILVLPARTAALFTRLCALGQVVEQIDVPEGTHDSVTNLARDDIASWVADRFAGRPAADDC